MRRVVTVILVSLIMICLLSLMSRQAVTIRQEPSNLLRLHITANSNSLQDQFIKRQIREVILDTGQDLFAEVTDISKAKKQISLHHYYLTRTIQRRLNELGADYQAQIKLKKTDFPRRSYGNLTLPAGKYQALNVVLGQGNGENWWCVLFPPLCLVNSKQKQTIDNKKLAVKLKQMQKKEKIPIKFKFKLLEYLKNNREVVELKGKLGNIFWKKTH